MPDNQILFAFWHKDGKIAATHLHEITGCEDIFTKALIIICFHEGSSTKDISNED